MQKRYFILLLLACTQVMYGAHIATYAQSPKASDIVTLKERIVTVPAGFTFKSIFMTPVNSATSYNGQEVTLALGTDLYYKDKMIAPAGSAITGTVIEVFKAKHGTVNGKLTLRFTHIMTPLGLDIPISAIIKTSDNSGVLIGGKDDDSLENPETLTVSGKAIQSLTTTDTINRGAFPYMNSAGSGGGLLKSVWDKGVEVNIPVNTQVELILTQPITVNPSVVQNE